MGSKDLGLVTFTLTASTTPLRDSNRLYYAASRLKLPLLRRFAAPTASTTPLAAPDWFYYAASRLELPPNFPAYVVHHHLQAGTALKPILDQRLLGSTVEVPDQTLSWLC